MENYKVVSDMRTLKAMEKRGLIKLHPHTGTIVRRLYGGTTKAYYIDKAIKKVFEYKGENYEEKYIDGCFCPYICKIIK